MFNIKTEIVQEIIAGLTAIITVAVSYFVGRFQTKYKEEREVLSNQLKTVYEPLICIFLRNECRLTDEDVRQITYLLYNRNSLVAPGLIQSWKKTCEEEAETDYHHFYENLRSNYNFVKKRLGYPYVAEDIKEKYHPNGYIETKQFGFVALSATIVSLLCAVMSDLKQEGIWANVLCIMEFVFLFLGGWMWVIFAEKKISDLSEWIRTKKSRASHQDNNSDAGDNNNETNE